MRFKQPPNLMNTEQRLQKVSHVKMFKKSSSILFQLLTSCNLYLLHKTHQMIAMIKLFLMFCFHYFCLHAWTKLKVRPFDENLKTAFKKKRHWAYLESKHANNFSFISFLCNSLHCRVMTDGILIDIIA